MPKLTSHFHFSFILIFLPLLIFSQTPEYLNYQAVVRDNQGNIVKNTLVSIRISILKGSTTGIEKYKETHSITTNDFGLINISVGNGIVKSGDFKLINWGDDSYYIQLEIDINGGSQYTLMGVSQLLSVPYALFSKNGIQINTNMTCNTEHEGVVRYNSISKKLETCNGTTWVNSNSFDCGNIYIDPRDGNIYPTTLIGSQCWMTKNLNIGLKISGMNPSNNNIIEKYCYNNDERYCAAFGGLYTWNELMKYSTKVKTQGICPSGWHIPGKSEYQELINNYSSSSGMKLKAGGSSGFNALMAGYRDYSDVFKNGEKNCYLFTSSKTDASHATTINITSSSNDAIVSPNGFLSSATSVRCIKD